MIDGTKPYPAYKESGLPWLGKVPLAWTTPRTKSRFRLSIEKSGTAHGKELLSIYTHIGVRPRKDLEERGNKATTTDGYWVVRKGDIIVNKLLAWMGAVGVSHYDGVTSPAYDILRPLQQHEPDYYHHLFRTSLYLQLFKARSRGIMDMRLRLYFDELGQIPLLCPPLDEQAAIVLFLDHANGKIEKAVRAKRKLIALLNEQKQAIIHQAVTRGLDPNVKLKPSGIPWLGDVPEHWTALRSKYLYREVDQRSALGAETHLSMSQKLGLVPRSQVEQRGLVSDSYAGAKLCIAGDLVLNRLKAHLGVFALAPQPGLVSPDYTVLRQVRELEPRFFESVYRTPACRIELRQRAKGIVQGFWRLYTDDFYDIRVPVPPPAEQRHIMKKIDHETTTLNAASVRAEREIELLREYRTTLTADVVTGKLDVREAVRGLPEASEETPPDEGRIDEPEDTEEAEE